MTESWTDRDSAMWETCAIIADLVAGRLARRPTVPATFALLIDPSHERLLAQGNCKASVRVAGDGTYVRKSGWTVGIGPVGVALAGATIGARAIGNRRRKSQAIRDAQPRWQLAREGTIYVGTEGFYLQGVEGLLCWSWRNVLEAEIAGDTGIFVFRSDLTENQPLWMMSTAWAELLLVLWALRVSPHHPRLVGADWLPPDYPERFRNHGRGWYDVPGAVQRAVTSGN